MLSPKVKRNISRIIPFGLIWFVANLVFFIVEKAAIGDSDYASTAIRIDFEIFVFGSLATIFVGLVLGTFEVLFLEKVFAKKSFTKKIVYKIIVYILLMFVITIITYPIAASLELNTIV